MGRILVYYGPEFKAHYNTGYTYTMIDLFASSDNVVVQRSYDWITTQDYNKSSSSLWLYFVIVSAIIGIVYAVYNRLCIKKWE